MEYISQQSSIWKESNDGGFLTISLSIWEGWPTNSAELFELFPLARFSICHGFVLGLDEYQQGKAWCVCL